MSKQNTVSYLDAHTIRTYTHAYGAQYAPTSLQVLGQVNSTTHYLHQHYPHSHMAVVISDSQSAGIGSYGRSWSSPPGVGIWLSFSWRGHRTPSCLSSLRIGYAVWEAITPYCTHTPKLKWPNDIVYQEKKLGGIRLDSPTSDMLIIGIGLNVFPHRHQCAPAALALSSISNQMLCRNRLTAAILCRCQWHLTHANTFNLLPAWRKHDALKDTYLHFTVAEQFYEGLYAGIDPAGALRINNGKTVESFPQAHITQTIRKNA